jgi:hypothetical protein
MPTAIALSGSAVGLVNYFPSRALSLAAFEISAPEPNRQQCRVERRQVAMTMSEMLTAVVIGYSHTTEGVP